MSKSLDYYDKNAKAYHARVHSWNMSTLYGAFLKHFSGQTILDLGCGTGRDACYFSERAFHVIAVDGSKELLAMAQKESPASDCRLIDFRNPFSIGTKVDGVWACASLLHFDDDMFETIVRTVCYDLRDGGIFYMGLKIRDVGELPDDERQFHYWTLKKLEPVAKRCGLALIEHNVDESPRIAWLNAYFVKA
ncbi:MAG TPA: class I SAM-dependent methyltransferase [Oligoflexus sp.]|uniref:class I SAM-dependent methyltransferase n=1 Tax=Oligoflexus sp. TaxID=1971216 RepID=UPI002D66A034|nr:class I SAM-dependent methyltransferase [Oligoflexus sp.]HYX36489.1 class I SAM-dependent methyltransferase [Oligoflexus sp.]